MAGPNNATDVVASITTLGGAVARIQRSLDQIAPVFNTLAHVVNVAATAYAEAARQSPPPAQAAAPTQGGSGAGSAEAVQSAVARPLGALAGTLSAVGRVARPVAGAFAAVHGAMAGAAGAAVAFGNSLLSFISKANPAAMQRFQLAVNDLFATIGAALIPVFELLTALVRTVADAMTLMIPVGHQLAAALQPVFELLGEAIAKYIGFLAQVLKAIVPVFAVVIRVLMDVANWVAKVAKQFLELLGIDMPDEAKKGASVGMAARQAQIGGVEDVLRKAMTSAFGTGLGANDPASKTASAVEGIRATTDKLYAYLKDQFPKDLEKWLTTDMPAALGKLLTRGAAAVGEALTSPTGPASVRAALPGGSGVARFLARGALDDLRRLDTPPPQP